MSIDPFFFFNEKLYFLLNEQWVYWYWSVCASGVLQNCMTSSMHAHIHTYMPACIYRYVYAWPTREPSPLWGGVGKRGGENKRNTMFCTLCSMFHVWLFIELVSTATWRWHSFSAIQKFLCYTLQYSTTPPHHYIHTYIDKREKYCMHIFSIFSWILDMDSWESFDHDISWHIMTWISYIHFCSN